MEGWLHDQQILHEFRPWNFRVQDILDSVKITLHYGEQDLVMISQRQQLSVAIPFATLKKYPEKGHLSTMLDNLDTIFSSLRQFLGWRSNYSISSILPRYVYIEKI